MQLRIFVKLFFDVAENFLCFLDFLNRRFQPLDLQLLFFNLPVKLGDLFGSLLLFVIKNGQVLLVSALLLPLDTVPLHNLSEDFLFGKYPPIQFVVAFSLAFEAHIEHSLFQRNSCFQTSLAPSCERYKVNMDMRRCFVHMKVRREHSQVGIALLEALIVFVEDFPRKLGVLSCR